MKKDKYQMGLLKDKNCERERKKKRKEKKTEETGWKIKLETDLQPNKIKLLSWFAPIHVFFSIE